MSTDRFNSFIYHYEIPKLIAIRTSQGFYKNIYNK